MGLDQHAYDRGGKGSKGACHQGKMLLLLHVDRGERGTNEANGTNDTRGRANATQNPSRVRNYEKLVERLQEMLARRQVLITAPASPEREQELREISQELREIGRR